MTLNQLRYFEAVAQYGSISRAAKVLFVAQPSVSVALRELEEELGFPLLERSGSGSRPTEKGERLLTYIQEIFSAMEQIEAMVVTKDAPMEGSFSVGVDSRFSARVLSDALLFLTQEHPGLDIRVEARYSCSEMFRNIAAGHLLGGVAMVEVYREAVFYGRARQLKLRMERLFTDEQVFIVRPEHPLAERQEVTLAELLKYPYVSMMNSDEFFQSDRYRFFRLHGYRQRTVFLNDTAEIERFVMYAKSNPITLMGSRHLSIRRGDGVEKFQTIRAVDVPLTYSLFWIWRKMGDPGPSSALLAALQKAVTSLPEYHEEKA